MGKCKTKAIRTDLATFQANPKPYVTLAHLELWYIQNPDILTTLVYSETPYIWNAGIFKIRGIFKILSNICDEEFCENS